MHIFSSEISIRVKRRLEEKNPDLLLYLDNPYLEELINNLIDVFSQELAEILNKQSH